MELRVSSESGFKLYNNLISLTAEESYHESHGVRHPADILIKGLSSLNMAFEDFVIHKESNGFEDRKEKSIRDYIFALDHFYERLLHIIKALSPRVSEDNKDVEKWLVVNAQEKYTSFKDATSSSHNIIRKIANALKHDTHDIDYVYAEDSDRNKFDGFYFSNVIGKNDLTGPDSDIHNTYKGGSTAISYNYFVKFSAGFVSNCIFHLNKIIFGSKKGQPEYFLGLFEFLEKASEFDEIFFPDEYSKPLGIIKREKKLITIDFPRRIRGSNVLVSCHPLCKVNQRIKVAHNNWPYLKMVS